MAFKASKIFARFAEVQEPARSFFARSLNDLARKSRNCSVVGGLGDMISPPRETLGGALPTRQQDGTGAYRTATSHGAAAPAIMDNFRTDLGSEPHWQAVGQPSGSRGRARLIHVPAALVPGTGVEHADASLGVEFPPREHLTP